MDQPHAPDLLAPLDPAESAAVAPPATPPATPPAPALAGLSAIWSSPAIPAFLDVRAEQLLRYGHSPAADRAAPRDKLLRAAADRLRAALEKADTDPAYALRKIAIAGACLIAAHDRIAGELAEKGQGA